MLTAHCSLAGHPSIPSIPNPFIHSHFTHRRSSPACPSWKSTASTTAHSQKDTLLYSTPLHSIPLHLHSLPACLSACLPAVWLPSCSVSVPRVWSICLPAYVPSCRLLVATHACARLRTAAKQPATACTSTTPHHPAAISAARNRRSRCGLRVWFGLCFAPVPALLANA